jgi:hypothetical protein
VCILHFFFSVRSTTVRGGFYKNSSRSTETSLRRLSARTKCNGFGILKAAGEDGIFPGLLQHGIEFFFANMQFYCMFGVLLQTACMEGSEVFIYA